MEVHNYPNIKNHYFNRHIGKNKFMSAALVRWIIRTPVLGCSLVPSLEYTIMIVILPCPQDTRWPLLSFTKGSIWLHNDRLGADYSSLNLFTIPVHFHDSHYCVTIIV